MKRSPLQRKTPLRSSSPSPRDAKPERGKPGPKPLDPAVRFARMVKQGETPTGRPDLGPCLLYTGATNGNGYGQFRYKDGRRNGYAHRFAWEHERGPIPDGLTVDHLCRVRNCVRVEHMELVDSPTNTRRGAQTKTTCKNGHERSESTVYITPSGTRTCRTCRVEAWRRLGKTRSGVGERAARRAVRARSGGHCEIRTGWCQGSASNFSHRRARSQGGGWSAANGIDCCGLGNSTGCHGYLHQHPAEAREKGWIVPSHQDPTATEVLLWHQGRQDWFLLKEDGSVELAEFPSGDPRHPDDIEVPAVDRGLDGVA